MRTILVAAIFGVGAAGLGATAPAFAASDPAAQQVERFEASLIETMKAGKSLGPEGRYRRLEPAVDQAFNLPLMTRFVVGPRWNGFSRSDQATLIKAFRRDVVATYAHNFDDYNGEKFDTLGVDTRGPDKLVRTQVTPRGQAATALSYRMQQSGGSWKIIDVYFNGAISQLTTQRSDFASAPTADALTQKINDLADRELKPQ